MKRFLMTAVIMAVFFLGLSAAALAQTDQVARQGVVDLAGGLKDEAKKRQALEGRVQTLENKAPAPTPPSAGGLTEDDVIRLIRKYAVELNGPTLKALKAELAAAKSQGDKAIKEAGEVKNQITEIRKDVGDLKANFQNLGATLAQVKSQVTGLDSKIESKFAEVVRKYDDLNREFGKVVSVTEMAKQLQNLGSLAQMVTQLQHDVGTLQGVSEETKVSMDSFRDAFEDTKAELSSQLEAQKVAQLQVFAALAVNDPEDGGKKPRSDQGKGKIQDAASGAAQSLGWAPPEPKK